MERKYSLGLDIGISSVGWAAIDQDKPELIDFGVRRFNQAEEAKTARLARSARRNLRRKNGERNNFLMLLMILELSVKMKS